MQAVWEKLTVTRVHIMDMTDNHFTIIVSASPLGVEATDQYMWLIILRNHFPTRSQSFCFAKASNFLWKPIIKS